VKKALTSVEENKEFEIAVRLISSPLYEIATHTPKIQPGIDAINEQLKQIENNIIENKGR
jgi:translation initiation factor 2 alpha subunit (eIF-2alpha)